MANYHIPPGLNFVPTSLVELLQTRTYIQGDKRAYTFLVDGENTEQVITYEDLDLQSKLIASYLKQYATSGERALLLYPTGLEYIAAFLGCLYAGVIAVPVYPPDPARLNRTLPRLLAVIKDAQPVVALTTSPILSMVKRLGQQAPMFQTMQWLTTDDLVEETAVFHPSPIDLDTIAFLQYTSGSTAAPKGIMVSHGNLLYNEEMLRQAFEHTPDSTYVNWLPLYHDMGLIGNVLQSLYINAHCILLSPQDFLKKPFRWLQAISRYRAHTSGGPNFAYDLCIRKVTEEQKNTLDLSSWRLAFNGAEPVRAETLTRFAAAFASCGFRAEASYPCYGLAEATLFVSGEVKAERPLIHPIQAAAMQQGEALPALPDDGEAFQAVGCGRSWLDEEIVIVDPETKMPCPAGRIGEIWVSGPHVAQGYWQRPDLNEATFRAQLTDRQGVDFLRTGDLGFLQDGELFITGRIKDLIIVNGRNHYPQDIELTVEKTHPAIRPGCGAAFSIDVAGGERLVVVYEVRSGAAETDLPGLIAAVRRAIAQTHELSLYAFALLETRSIPKTSSGKIQRHACRKLFLRGELDVVTAWQETAVPSSASLPISPPITENRPTAASIRHWLLEQIAAEVGVSPQVLDVHQPLVAYGLDSVRIVSLTGELEGWLERPLSPTLIWDHPTIHRLAHHLAGTPLSDEAVPASMARPVIEPIAIVGMGCRFPGAANLDAFWRLLTQGMDAITEVPPERWPYQRFYDPEPGRPGKMNTRWGGFTTDIDRFDARFFGISPREASRMDPQQRLLLEVVWEALANAGLPPDSLKHSPTGVFVGISANDYGRAQFNDLDFANAYAGTGNALSIAANRISYLLGLHGPSMAVDTACSSSLVAVHLACQSLWLGECEAAVVGGANLILSPEITISISQAGVTSPDGRCQTFDAHADGYVRGEGAGAIILKPLSAAQAAGDPIYCVIRGTATNNDGRTNGLIAPNRPAQIALLQTAYRRAGITPDTVQYIEAHGTGTAVGDAIEAQAIGEVMGAARTSPCYVGSVKSNIGHLEAAAGIAGLIKTALALRHRQLPPTLHVQTPNPRVDWAGLHLAIAQDLTAWPKEAGETAVAGVSSFGFGGTNAHVVLSESPPTPAPAADDAARPRLLTLSAHSEPALQALAQETITYLQQDEQAAMPDICYTANVRRTHYPHRLAVVVQSKTETAVKLAEFLTDEHPANVSAGLTLPDYQRRIVFLFSGQGGQWGGMGQSLLRQEPVFRRALERCNEVIQPLTGQALPDILDSEQYLKDIALLQPLLFSLQVALANLWGSWGIEPDAVIGHSLGEVAAAHVSGALSLADAAQVICHRSRLLKQISGQGGMAQVALSAEAVRPYLAGYTSKVSIAALNSPNSTVLSGKVEALQAIAASLQSQDIFARMIDADVAGHSPQTELLSDALQSSLAGIIPTAEKIPYISTVTGRHCAGTGLDVAYWGQNLCQPVQFMPAIHSLLDDQHPIFIEIGPHPVLATAVSQILAEQNQPGSVIHSWRRGRDERQEMLGALGRLYTMGIPVNWGQFYPVHGRVVSLPAIPWQRERHWFDSQVERFRPQRHDAEEHPLLGRPLPLSPTISTRVWQKELTLADVSFLADHQVQGQIILPATAYLEMVLAAVRQGNHNEGCTLRNVRFHRPLVLSESKTQTVQLTLQTEEAGQFSFQIFSLGEDGATWQQHATGDIASLEEQETPAELPLAGLQTRLKTTMPGDDLYQKLAGHGLTYGPRLLGITRLWHDDQVALGRVQLPPALEAADDYQFHPALFDSCLHALAALPMHGQGDTYLPAGIDGVTVYGKMPSSPTGLWSLARQTPSPSGTVRSDVDIADESGRVLARVHGLQLQLLPASTENDQQWFYELSWQPQPANDEPQSTTPARWLVFADQGGVAEALGELLAGQGASFVWVTAGETFRQVGNGRYEVNPDDSEGVRRLWQDIAAERPCQMIAYLWPLDNPPLPAPSGSFGCAPIVQLVQALAVGEPQAERPSLWLVTAGAQAVQPEDDVALAQSPIWGLGRTIALEHPEFWGGLIDLDPAADVSTQAQALWQALIPPNNENQLAFRAQTRYAARLARQPASQTPSFSLKPDAAYLITGGLGDLGLAAAGWLVEQGARHLILWGRTPLPAREKWPDLPEGSREMEQVTAVQALEAKGATICLAAVDVSCETEIESFLNSYEQANHPPIRGVVHAAGVLADRALVHLDTDSLAAVMQPKVAGSWQLHRLLETTPLDFFVLFSSVAALLGSPGQGHYAAANAFLDGLAHHRRRRGQPGLSINWGPWAEIGLAARLGDNGRIDSQGIRDLSPAEGIGALARLMRGLSTQTAVLPADWSHLSALYPVHQSFLSRLVGSTPADERLEKRPSLSSLPPEERRAAAAAYIRAQASRALQLPLADCPLDAPLNSLGLDSLMAIEVKNRLETGWGLVIPVINFLDGSSISQIADKVVHKLAEINTADLAVGLTAVNPLGQHPLSHGQRAIWFLNQLAPTSPAYNIPGLFRIRGRVDTPALQRALQKLADRHPSLRTRFPQVDGEPVQEVLAQLPLACQVRPVASGESLEEHLTREMHRSFDLEHGPLFRAFLFSQSDDAHTFLLVVHHIIMDFWSLSILMDELGLLVEAETSQKPVILDELPLSYADYVYWQQDLLDSPEGKRLSAYWLARLAGELPTLNLPVDKLRPSIQSYEGKSYSFKLDAALTQQLKTLAQRQGVSLYTLLLAAYQLLLHRYTGQADILVGSPIIGRSRAEFAGIVGYFNDPVVLRSTLAANPAFVDFLAQARQTVLAALDHQEYPFALLVEQLAPARDPRRSPIYQTVFLLQQPHLPGEDSLPAFGLGQGGVQMAWGGLSIESMTLKQRIAQMDLMLMMAEVRGELVGSFQFNTALFVDETIIRLAAHFQHLLAGFVAAPYQPVLSIPFLTDSERYDLLVNSNNTHVEFPQKTLLLHELFEEQADRSPGATAVVSNNVRLTYAQLEQKANQIAHQLHQTGIRPNQLVAVVMEKGWEQIATVLGIQKAGTAYLPVDPALPAERYTYLLESADATVAMTQPWLADRIVWPAGVLLIVVSDEMEVLDAERPLRQQQPGDLAYVIFTSGSTGIPKGVMITHQAAVNTVLDMNGRFQINAADRVLALSSLSFDLSVYDIFGMLAAGGTIVLPSPQASRDPAAWVALMAQEQVTLWNSVPALLRMLVAYCDGRAPCISPSLRQVWLSGDWIPVTLPDQIRVLAPNAQIISLGGATEASIWSITYPIAAVDPAWPSIPYGQPLGNQQYYVLNRALEPCPIGVTGELYIGGQGVAQGYLGQPRLTAEKFIPDPFSIGGGMTLYKTGDLGRFLPDGNIEFQGRADFQVKIQGYRIEPGEIEVHLAQHPRIRESLVIARDDSAGSKYLVAYVVSEATADELADFLSQKLPGYMVPAAFVILEAMPLTPNGKVDREALPPADGCPAYTPAAPRTPTEETLARIWQALLPVDQIGIHDDFFQSGGHSLLATQIISRVRNEWQIELPLITLFQNPTIADLAPVIEAQVKRTTPLLALNELEEGRL